MDANKIILLLFLYVLVYVAIYGGIIAVGVWLIYELVTHIGHLGDLHGILAIK